MIRFRDDVIMQRFRGGMMLRFEQGVMMVTSRDTAVMNRVREAMLMRISHQSHPALEDSQTAYLLSFTWVSHIAALVLIRQ